MQIWCSFNLSATYMLHIPTSNLCAERQLWEKNFLEMPKRRNVAPSYFSLSDIFVDMKDYFHFNIKDDCKKIGFIHFYWYEVRLILCREMPDYFLWFDFWDERSMIKLNQAAPVGQQRIFRQETLSIDSIFQCSLDRLAECFSGDIPSLRAQHLFIIHQNNLQF